MSATVIQRLYESKPHLLLEAMCVEQRIENPSASTASVGITPSPSVSGHSKCVRVGVVAHGLELRLRH